jgi:GNAT superfamily N-acetyltransferase
MSFRPDEYEIIPYRPEFTDQIVELQSHMWSPDLEKNAAFLKWKYDDNPYADKPIIYLALHAGQVVGMEGAFSTCWQIGQPSQMARCLLTADAVVHPDHRRRGLFEKITSAILEELSNSYYDYIFALTANPASSANFVKLGWRRASSMQMALWPTNQRQGSGARRLARQLPFVRPLYRRLRHYRDQRSLLSASNRLPFDALDKNSVRRRPDRFSQVYVETAPRPEAMAKLVERIGNNGRMRQVRDQQFFTWRFQNPLSLYRFMLWEGDELEGYLILQTPAVMGDDNWINIVDWEASSKEAQTDLLRAALHWGDFDTMTIWSASLPDEVKVLLSECNFHFLEEAYSLENALYCPSILVRPVRPEMLQRDWVFADRQLLDMSNWDVRAIYSDDY